MTHDADDLPPKKEPPHDSTFSVVLGEVTGAIVWIAIFLVVVGAIAWMVIKWVL
jgi:hypothetical protein